MNTVQTRNSILAAVAALALVIGAGLPDIASAGGRHHRHHGHHHGGYRGSSYGFYFGAAYPYWGYRTYVPPPHYYGYYPPYGYYDGPRYIAAPSQPAVYIERNEVVSAADDGAAYWYYCRDAEAYFPYVKQCPGGWERQVPQSPPDDR